MRVIVYDFLLGFALGHGYMNEPPSRTGAILEVGGSGPYGSSLWFNQGCTIGCPTCGGEATGYKGCGAFQGNATLPHDFRTYHQNREDCGIMPWCAPGSAPVFNPCGVAGGGKIQGAAGLGGDAPPGYKQGDLGTEMRDAVKGLHRTWKAGDAVDVAWAMVANHGGGYQYRLCPKGSPQTEECFQQTPLEYVGDDSFIQYCDVANDKERLQFLFSLAEKTPEEIPVLEAFPKHCNRTNRTAIPAKRLNTGTIPKGSTWTRNPVPACKNVLGGAFDEGCRVSTNPGRYPVLNASDYQFPPLASDLSRPGKLVAGWGITACFGCDKQKNPGEYCKILRAMGRGSCDDDELQAAMFQWSVVDKVRVPQVPPGEYVVSFRWDSEQSPQVWAQCSDVTIV